MKSNKSTIQVRQYQYDQYGSRTTHTVAETIRRTLRAECIGNFNPLFCRFAGDPRVVVHSDAGDGSDPFRRDASYLETLWIEAPAGYTTPETVADLYRRDPAAACRRALRETRNLFNGSDASAEVRLARCNELLEMHGTEAIRGDWQNGYWCDVVATYCNAGDTYDCTVLCVRGDSSFDSPRFLVTSWGDFVERNEKRLGIA
jgi:hypothetical protein